MLSMSDRYGHRVEEVYDSKYDNSVSYIALHLRDEDFDELYASTGKSPHYDVLESWEMSTIRWIIFNEFGQAVAVMGVRPITAFSEVGIPWLVGTDKINKDYSMKRFFVKMTKLIAKEIMESFSILVNYVDARYAKAIKWIKVLGFTIEEAEPFGAKDMMFHKFHWERK